jgi:hypothetical protein
MIAGRCNIGLTCMILGVHEECRTVLFDATWQRPATVLLLQVLCTV